ncbi:MAG: 3-coathanger stack domain-containing protein [Flavobacteriales bacterium]
MKRFACLVALCCALVQSNAQFDIDFEGKAFFQLSAALQNHYDSLAASGDSSAFHEGGPYSKYRRWREYWSLRLRTGTNFSDYFSAEAFAIADRQSRAAGNTDPWHEIGPKDKPSLGQTTIGQGSQPGIGPIHFISFSDVDANKMLCGSVIGGLWYTDNQGLQWSNGGSDGGTWARTGCRDGLFKVGDPSTWYAANSGYFFHSGAILRGTNYGANWEVIADQADFANGGGVWTKVNKLATNHEDPDVLYVATEHRLWRTDNANDPNPTWYEVAIPLPSSVSAHPIYGTNSGYYYHDGRNVYDFEVDPLNGANLYATVRFDGELTGPSQQVHFWRLMRSQDGGATWSEMPNQPLHPFNASTITVWIDGQAVQGVRMSNSNLMTIETTKANADWLYVFYDLATPAQDALFKISSVTSGNWEPPLRTTLIMTYGGGNGFGVDQHNGTDVYLDHNQSIGRYATYINGIWTNYSSAGNYLQYHVDVEDFVGDPEVEGVVWMANHGGIHRSSDFGATWEWRGRGLAVAEVYRMKNSHSEPDRLITGLFHDASVLTVGSYEPGWEPEWFQLGGADGQQPMIEHDEGNWVYWSSQSSSWRKSGDYGVSASSISAWSCASLEWETMAAMDHGNPNAIYFPGWPSQSPNPCNAANVPAEIKRSFNRGVSWEIISDFQSIMGLGRMGVWRLYSSPYDPNDLLVHFPNGQRVFRTRMARGNAAAVRQSWSEIHVPRIDRFISDIDFDPTDSDVLYFAYSSEVMQEDVPAGSGMVFKVIYNDPANPLNASVVDLTAFGSTSNPLPNTGIGSEAMALERGSNGGIYVATDLGVYFTNNEFLGNGTGWQLLGANLPHRSCAGLEISYKANKIRAGMSGRGVWEHDLWCPSEPDWNESGTYTADAFKEAINDITSTAIVPAGLDVTYRAGNQVRLLPGFHAQQGSDFHAFIHPCDRAGNSFKSSPSVGYPLVKDNIARLKQDVILHVVPNPNMGAFLVHLPDDSAAAKEIQLLSTQGRRIPFNWRQSSSVLEVSLEAHTPAGMYLVQVVLKDGTTHHSKFILEP